MMKMHYDYKNNNYHHCNHPPPPLAAAAVASPRNSNAPSWRHPSRHDVVGGVASFTIDAKHWAHRGAATLRFSGDITPPSATPAADAAAATATAPVAHKHQHQHQHHQCVCCNCGGVGHMYKHCNQPITSYGCIVYTWTAPADGKATETSALQYLLVQRRDSLAYVEFLRGKYRLDNVRYIMQLLRGMTREELTRLREQPFEELWTQLWMGASRNFVKEQTESDAKLTHLKNGYMIRKDNSKDHVTLDALISRVSDCLPETEWGFPKGRRNLMESDKACAIREFREETGFRPSEIRIRGHKPVDEVFTGSNGVRYRHVYYVAEYVGGKKTLASRGGDAVAAAEAAAVATNFETNEIKAVSWMSFEEAMSKFSHRDCNVEKRELLKRVNGLISRYASAAATRTPARDPVSLPALAPTSSTSHWRYHHHRHSYLNHHHRDRDKSGDETGRQSWRRSSESDYVGDPGGISASSPASW